MPNVMAYNKLEVYSSAPGAKTRVIPQGYFFSPLSDEGFQMNIIGFNYQRG
jgi:hypothetical protein